MKDEVFLVDGCQLLAEVATRFAEAIASGRYEDAQRYAELAFFLLRHGIDMGER
jgi:hypothetical protein